MNKYQEQITKLVESNPHQLSEQEYLYITETISSKIPGNFLIFSVGKDSGLWMDINAEGKTVFLEDNPEWLQWAKSTYQGMEAYLVKYDTQRKQWQDLLNRQREGENCLSMELPESIISTEWDFIFVDAPAGYLDETPGRMKSIYTAAKLAFTSRTNHTDVFVHDCDREVEDMYTNYFLHQDNLVSQLDRLRHYKITN